MATQKVAIFLFDYEVLIIILLEKISVTPC